MKLKLIYYYCLKQAKLVLTTGVHERKRYSTNVLQTLNSSLRRKYIPYERGLVLLVCNVVSNIINIKKVTFENIQI